MRIYLLVTLSITVSLSNAQSTSDSLLRKIGFFKRFSNEEFYTRKGYPQATGFYIRTDSIGELYIATAGHVLHRPDSSSIAVNFRSLGKNSWQERMGEFVDIKRSNLIVNHPDSFVDMILLDLSLPPEAAIHPWLDVYAFTLHDIVTKSEYDSIQVNSALVYIGMLPDSISSERTMWYQIQTGRFFGKWESQEVVRDRARKFSSIPDFLLTTPVEGGVSGSPVFIRSKEGLKVLGIINGFLTDNRWDHIAYATAAYRILEALELHHKMRRH